MNSGNEAYRGNKCDTGASRQAGKQCHRKSPLEWGYRGTDFLCLSTPSAQVIGFQVENSNGVRIPRKSLFCPLAFSVLCKK